MVDAAGPALMDARGLWVLSTRTIHRFLELWRKRLMATEKLLLAMYSRGTEPDPEDSFPDLCLTPRLGDASDPLPIKVHKLSLHTSDKKTIDLNCVRVIHKKTTDNRPPSAWSSSRLGGDRAVSCWRVLYKPKKGGRRCKLGESSQVEVHCWMSKQQKSSPGRGWGERNMTFPSRKGRRETWEKYPAQKKVMGSLLADGFC